MKLLISLICLSIFVNAKTLVDIPEASGIDYSKSTNSFFVANDEGTIYEMNKKGKILNKNKIGKYDLEGITDYSDNTFAAIAEKKGKILFIDKSRLKFINATYIKKESYKKFLKKPDEGFEGISYSDGKFYLAIQSKKAPSYILIINESGHLKDFIKLNVKDISGLKVLNNKLYAISDKEDIIIEYNLNSQEVKKSKLKGKNQEGITFFKKKLYIADDSSKVISFKNK